jgi:hypothetical protein
MLIAAQIMIAAWGLYRVKRHAPHERRGTFVVEPPVPASHAS